MLTPEQVEQYKEEGYTIAPGFFSPREAEALRMELARLEASGAGRDVMPLPELQNIHFTPLDEVSDLFRALPFKEEVVTAVGQLIGDPVLLWLDQIFLKPARVGAGNVWHEDNARYQAPDVTRGAGMWIALHDATRANGTLEVIPYSHHQSDLTVAFRTPTAEEEAQAVAAEMAAGGAAFFNVGLLHCTRDNPSDGPRAAAIYHFLAGDNLPAAEFLHHGKNIPLSGPETSGGLKEYGRQIAGTWEAEVERCLADEVPGT